MQLEVPSLLAFRTATISFNLYKMQLEGIYNFPTAVIGIGFNLYKMQLEGPIVRRLGCYF